MKTKTYLQKLGLTQSLMDYEEGSLNENEILDLFSELIKNGMAWTLQGAYGRMARALIESDYISTNGKIKKYYN
tara:strand:+ start:9038 stop:9259 length:222 start_codon:yes stop_codon:yes gene_type:complete